MSLAKQILVFVKGFIMGIVNVVPVSSGAISLVLGVFERFVNAFKSLNIRNFRLLFRGEFSEFARKTDVFFLLVLFLGISIGMLLTSVFLKSVFVSYEVYTWSFFIGLVLASVVYVMRMIEKVNAKTVFLLLAGALASFFLSIHSNPVSNEGFGYLVLCGIIGTMGIVVPGISGSHLMLLMGNYELIVTKAIPDLMRWSTFPEGFRILFPFLIGTILSLLVFSYLLSWLMKAFRNETMSVLSGFMLGSLPVIYPWKTAAPNMENYIFSLPPITVELVWAVVFALVGAVTVLAIELLAKRKERKS